MVTEISLTLHLLSPMSLHRTRAGVQYVETLDYIPGTAIRGALAEAYLAEHAQVDNRFRDLFLSDKVQYGDLWPITPDGTTVLVPASAQACKRYKLRHKSSLRDSLLDSLLEPQEDRKCRERDEEIRECEEPLDRMSGYLRSLDTVESLTVQRRLRVNTAIERGTGSVAREMLFTQHTLTGKRRTENDQIEDVFFQGYIRLAEPTLQNDLRHLLEKGSVLFFGASRSRGLGETEVISWQASDAGVPLNERWERFNATAQKAGGNSNKRYFPLTLLSHLVLRDDLLRPVLDGVGPQHFGLPSGVEWVRYKGSGQAVRFLSSVTVPGWNAAQGLPKPDTVALARGSVLLFQCDALLEQAVLAQLATIENDGIGARREEGFGRVVACYPFHYHWWRN